MDDPIQLQVTSPNCPDLTMIDLPGITMVSLDDQDEDIEKLTTDMARRYCEDDRTIILCVTPANQDMANSVGLKMARKLDKDGVRTIGVITKIDLMDEGTNAKDTLLNKHFKLKLGYVGVKGRSQADINRNLTVVQGIAKERDYFATHKVYCNLPKDILGTESLITKLTTVMYSHIRRVMPSIVQEIDEKIYDCRNLLEELGTPLPTEMRDKLMMLWQLISRFNDSFHSAITGEYNNDTKKVDKKLLGGAQIDYKFRELYMKELRPKHRASKKYDDKKIKNAIVMHTGDQLPGFISMDMFTALINPLLEDLRKPALVLIDEVHSVL